MIAAPLIRLADGSRIPQLGVGTYKVAPAVTAELVADALRSGYRHVDTAALYGNEAEVGEGLRRSGVPRGDVFVTTKLWNDDQGYDSALRAFDASAARLGLEAVALYLIHRPIPSMERYVQTRRAPVRITADGRPRACGDGQFATLHNIGTRVGVE